jgi:hypothetical protein
MIEFRQISDADPVLAHSPMVRAMEKTFDHVIGCWQTNANQSPLGQRRCPSPSAKITPLGERGGAVQFEDRAGGEATFLVEVVVDGGVDGGEFL